MMKHFGEVKENSEVEFVFEYYGPKKYKSHVESCGCIDARWLQSKKLYVKFDVGENKLNGVIFHKESTKSVTVYWQDGTSDALFIKAVVYKEEDL